MSFDVLIFILIICLISFLIQLLIIIFMHEDKMRKIDEEYKKAIKDMGAK